jgi:hypothetical protein
MVSTLEALVIMHGDAVVEYCYQRTPAWDYENDPHNGCVTQGPIILALQNKA